ncbi:MAG: SPOR domain-containing protein [Candidatus Marinimicrobia bacterium]|jgi:hypothetical protein|nr:hypothetical protein [Candidatus Neomarinimicrobiota bacterium]MDP6456091.1 SPOR domain-containing protein [Candidatus Neomarinimicrobiota bacterium]MDP6592875.1 SPOR domain-containing protein [Candidatus Neomarinimicrobiota bacterium]MDP6836148.1 SPOR domain-containing protein [Candidatus Neomarinimicrobiota bacterium]|tara:strand:- start:119 stop:553 length:435 start_codon:yes stop_codon:yes gene_type:complete
MRSLFAVIVFFFMVSGQDRKVKVDESFSPNTLSEPEIKWPVILRPGDELPEELKRTSADTTEEGYRIQVLSTLDHESAANLRTELLPLFDDEVYVIFDPPNYKVRVGNFRSRFDAERVQLRIRKMGYLTAWIIRSQVRVQQSRR